MKRDWVWAVTLWGGLAFHGLAAAPPEPPTVPVEIPSTQEIPLSLDGQGMPIEGTCMVQLKVTADGVPKDVKVMACTDERLKKYAETRVKGQTFTPAMQKGKPVNVAMMLPVIAHVHGLPDLRPEEPIKADASVKPPVGIYEPQPRMPQALLDLHTNASCVVDVAIVVDRNGLAHNAQVKKSCGAGVDPYAVAAVENYLFKPATKDGQPVAVHVTIEVKFEIY